MLLGFLLFEALFVHVVAITFTALVLNELLMVALTIRTWHGLMVLAQLFSVIIYMLSLVILNGYFGERQHLAIGSIVCHVCLCRRELLADIWVCVEDTSDSCHQLHPSGDVKAKLQEVCSSQLRQAAQAEQHAQELLQGQLLTPLVASSDICAHTLCECVVIKFINARLSLHHLYKHKNNCLPHPHFWVNKQTEIYLKLKIKQNSLAANKFKWH